MTFVDWIVVAAYASLVFEVVIWRVPSVASTYELVEAQSARSWFRFALPTTLGVTTYLLPLVLAFLSQVPWWCGPIPLPEMQAIVWLAIALVVLGRIFTLSAVGGLRDAHRGGSLVQRWPFTWSRNPALVGLYAFFLGNCLIYSCALLWVGLVVFVVNMHFRVQIEERHLARTFGDEYAAYRARVRRYV